jgi:hypothetical protein
MKIQSVWVMTLCKLDHRYRRFGGACCLNLQVQEVKEELTLTMEAASFPATSVTTYKSTWCQAHNTAYFQKRCPEGNDSE